MQACDMIKRISSQLFLVLNLFWLGCGQFRKCCRPPIGYPSHFDADDVLVLD